MPIHLTRWQHLARTVALLATLAVLLAGCDFPWLAKQSDVAKDQTLRLGWATGGSRDITTLDPAQCADTSCMQLVSLLYDGLVTVDHDEHVKPWGASSWTISPDGLTYTFRLRPNQHFSDGTPVRPSDYAWSINRSASPCLGSQLSFYLATIKDASTFSGETCSASGQPVGAITSLVGNSVIPDDSANTLTIKLAQPAGYFLAALTYSTAFALEKSAVTAPFLGRADTWLDNLATGKTGQGGSGMFYVAAWNHQGVLTLKRNPHWWGKKPNFTTVDFKLFSSTNVGYSAYQTDPKLAYSSTIPVDQIATAKGQPDYHEQPALITVGLILNWKITPFDDINARKAFCLAVDRDQFNQQVYHGQDMPTWHIIPQGMPGYNEHLHGLDNAPVAGNMTLARTYWQRYLTAHNNQVPRIIINFGFSYQPNYLEASTWLKNRWNQTFGIQTELDNTAWGHGPGWELSRQIVRSGWVPDYPDPQNILSNIDPRFRGVVDVAPDTGVPAADNLMRQADMLPDMSQRIPFYQQAEQLLIDNVAVCPLFQYVNHYALRPWVKGDFVEDARGMFPNDAWVSGYIARH